MRRVYSDGVTLRKDYLPYSGILADGFPLAG
jgi:hypothetical protein